MEQQDDMLEQQYDQMNNFNEEEEFLSQQRNESFKMWDEAEKNLEQNFVQEEQDDKLDDSIEKGKINKDQQNQLISKGKQSLAFKQGSTKIKPIKIEFGKFNDFHHKFNEQDKIQKTQSLEEQNVSDGDENIQEEEDEDYYIIQSANKLDVSVKNRTRTRTRKRSYNDNNKDDKYDQYFSISRENDKEGVQYIYKYQQERKMQDIQNDSHQTSYHIKDTSFKWSTQLRNEPNTLGVQGLILNIFK